MQNIVEKAHVISLNDSRVKELIQLDTDNVIGIYVDVSNPDALAEGFTNISISTQSGKSIAEPTNYKSWLLRQGGYYLEAIKPVSIRHDKSLFIEIESTSAPSKQVDFQLVFVHQC